MRRLVVDVRKAHDAGIGTYIHNVVPRVLKRLADNVSCTALVPVGSVLPWDWLPRTNLDVVDVGSAPLGFAEQFELRRRCEPGALFWATSLAHPLQTARPMVATLYDVAQVALPANELEAGWPVRLGAAFLLRSLRRRALALMAISRFTHDEFVRHVGTPLHGALNVIPLGVDEAWFDAPSAPAQRPYFVCVGSVRPHKNVERLLQAFALAADALPHDLHIVGCPQVGGREAAWLQHLSDAVRSRVRFTGAVDDTALRREIAGADALVFPSLYEGFGLPALEAMATGCPVLASTAGALVEACGGAAAAHFDPRDADAMARSFVVHSRLSADERRRLVEGGRVHARRFGWDATADATAAVIERTLHQLARR
jgi:glycosyltransferase involved in cell wall biosynthesis